jgi:hypothetical protein
MGGRAYPARMSEEESPRVKAAAGWYPHPSMANTRRYWDGQAWTDRIAPGEPPVNSGPSTSKIAGGVLLGVLAAVAAVWFVVGLATANDDLECSTESVERVLEGETPLDCD